MLSLWFRLLVVGRGVTTGVVSSSLKFIGVPRDELLLDWLLGLTLALKLLFGVNASFFVGSLAVSFVPLTLCPNCPGAGLAKPLFGCGVPPAYLERLGPGVRVCCLRIGDSGRGKDGLDFLPNGD